MQADAVLAKSPLIGDDDCSEHILVAIAAEDVAMEIVSARLFRQQAYLRDLIRQSIGPQFRFGDREPMKAVERVRSRMTGSPFFRVIVSGVYSNFIAVTETTFSLESPAPAAAKAIKEHL